MITELLFSVGSSLTANAIDRRLIKKRSFITEKKIEAKINEVVVAVIEPLSEFLSKEGVPEQEIAILIDAARPNILWLINNESFSFDRGLDEEIITRDLLAKNISSETINIEYLSAFETIVRALVDLVTKTPPIFEAWEKSSFQAIFSQLEDIKTTLSVIYSAMTNVASSKNAGNTDFEKLTKHRAATIALKTNIHGLRQTAIAQVELDKLFVFPEFMKNLDSNEDAFIIDDDDIIIDDANDIADDENVNNFEEFSDFIDKSLHVVIRAPAGAGKTTFSNWLLSKFLTCQERRFPIIFPLRRTLKSGSLPSLKEAFIENASPAFIDLISPERIAAWADEKRIVVIYEGLDEVSEQQRDYVIAWIQAMRIAYPNLIGIITSRPLSTDHLEKLVQDGWRSANLMPFNKERVVKYIAQFQKHGPNIQTGAKFRNPEQLADTWGSDQTLGPLTGNPLLLSTLLIVHHMDGELPDDRSKLYDRYIDGMLGLWELNKDLETPTVPLTKVQKKKILELIAINMISSETDAAPEEDVALWLDGYIKKERLDYSTKNILDHLRERSGLLIGPGQYTFAHKSIGEFLIAQCCNDGIQVNFKGLRFDRWLLKDNCSSDRWTTVTFLWSGIASTSEVQNFISSLIDEKNFSLAAELLFERRKFLERDWLEDTFWSCINLTVQDGFNPKNGSNIYASLDAPIQSLSSKPFNFELASVTSISNMHFHENEFIRLFSHEGLINPLEWEERLSRINLSVWSVISSIVDPSPSIIDSAPKQISPQGACYHIIRMISYGFHYNKEVHRLGIKSYSWLENYCDVEALEALVLVDMFITITLHMESKRTKGSRQIYGDNYISRRVSSLREGGTVKSVSDNFDNKKCPYLKETMLDPYTNLFISRDDHKDERLLDIVSRGIISFDEESEYSDIKEAIENVIFAAS